MRVVLYHLHFRKCSTTTAKIGTEQTQPQCFKMKSLRVNFRYRISCGLISDVIMYGGKNRRLTAVTSVQSLELVEIDLVKHC